MSESLNPDDVEIRFIKTARVDELIALYKAAGWWEKSYDDSHEFLHGIVADSALFAGAYIDKKMVGMGRALSDLASDAYIQDIAVLDAFRGRGIGHKIVKALIAGLKEKKVDWIGLIAEPGTNSFYEQLGFKVLRDHIPFKLEE